jgi:hypothetical protein
MRVSAAVLAAIALLTAASAAPASTVTRSGSEVTFTALPGERNLVSANSRPSPTPPTPQLFVSDSANQQYRGGSVPPDTPAGPGCEPADSLRGAFCGVFPVTLFRAVLGDEDDVIRSQPSGMAVDYDGGSGNDDLYGSPKADVMAGGSGEDILKGFGGPDTLDPGPGRDIVQARGGNDTIMARDGARDVISCGGGRDKVIADRRDRTSRACERVRRR